MEDRARAWQEVTGEKLSLFKGDLREYDFVHDVPESCKPDAVWSAGAGVLAVSLAAARERYRPGRSAPSHRALDVKKFWLITISDALATVILIARFARNRARWRDGVYTIRNGTLVPVVPTAPGDLQVLAKKKGVAVAYSALHKHQPSRPRNVRLGDNSSHNRARNSPFVR